MPVAERVGPTDVVVPHTVSADRVVLSVTRSAPDDQTLLGQYIDITEAGIRLRPWHIRYARPDQLDTMAVEAGLSLESRSAGWRDEPFDDDSPSHVSVYAPGGGTSSSPRHS